MKLSSDERGFLIAMTFLLILLYGLSTFQTFSLDADLPVFGHVSVSLAENLQYMIPLALLLAFFVFWKVRKERANGEGSGQRFE